MSLRRPITVFLNAARIDYDRLLDFSRLSNLTQFIRYEVDKVTDPNDILTKVGNDAEIVITKEMELTADVFEKFPPTVKLLCEAGTGYNNLPIEAATRRGVKVCTIPTYSTDSVAHMVITFLMNLSCSMIPQQRMLWSGDRGNFTGPFRLPLVELVDKTMGLIGGSGLIGSKVADVCLALGMKVVISSRSGRLPKDHRHANNERVTVVSDVDELLRVSDYVSVHCPLNDETRGSIGRDKISLMKKSAYLINTARGSIMNEGELLECLKEGVIAGAGLDVTVREPPEMDSPIWDLDNVILTPHIGWRRKETRQRLVEMMTDNIEAYCRGEFINVVND